MLVVVTRCWSLDSPTSAALPVLAAVGLPLRRSLPVAFEVFILGCPSSWAVPSVHLPPAVVMVRQGPQDRRLGPRLLRRSLSTVVACAWPAVVAILVLHQANLTIALLIYNLFECLHAVVVFRVVLLPMSGSVPGRHRVPLLRAADRVFLVHPDRNLRPPTVLWQVLCIGWRMQEVVLAAKSFRNGVNVGGVLRPAQSSGRSADHLVGQAALVVLRHRRGAVGIFVRKRRYLLRVLVSRQVWVFRAARHEQF